MIFSTKIKDVLQNNSENPICKYLLSIHNFTAYDKLFIDYIDTAVENSGKISFIPKEKLNNFIYSCIYTIYKINVSKLPILSSLGVKFNYIKVTDYFPSINFFKVKMRVHNKFEYINISAHMLNQDNSEELLKNCQYKFYNENYRLKHAVMTSPAKFIAKFNQNFSNKDIESFTQLFKPKKGKFKILKGCDILDGYHEDNYYNDKHTLGSSCMRYDECQNYLGIYTDNDNVSLLCYYIDDLVAGRALLWENVNFNDIGTKIFMDRIYTCNYDYKNAFIQYAKEHDYVYKKNQNYEDKTNFIYNKKEFSQEICIRLDNTDFTYYPYCDTFSYIDFPYLYNKDKGCGSLISTDGDIEDNTVYSEYHNYPLNPDDAVYSNHYGSYIREDESINIDDKLYHEDDDDICKCEHCSTWIIKANHNFVESRDEYCCEDCTVYSEYHNEYLIADTAVSYDNDYYYQSDMVYSEYHGKDIPEHLCKFIEELNDYILEDEVEEVLEEMKV